MNGIIYHSTDPSNSKANYISGDTIDFILSNDASRDIVLNANYGIRIEGKLRVNESNGTGTAGTRQTDSERVQMDNLIGIHGVIESIATEFQNVGQIELIGEYGRLHKAEQSATKSLDDMNNASQQVELKSNGDQPSRQYCKGYYTATDTGTAIADGTDARIRDMDFSFKPSFSLNRSSGNLPCSKSGFVKISINTARDINFLHGQDQSANNTFTLSDLRCCYYTVDANPNPPQISMRRVLNIKTSLNSAHANLSARVPAIVNSMIVNFQPSANENTAKFNNNDLHNLPNLNYIQFQFADSTSQYINYKMEDRGDQLKKFLEVMNSQHSQVSADKWKSNDAFALGLNFQDAVDLSSSKFNLELDTSFDFSSSPYVAYMYFFSSVQL